MVPGHERTNKPMIYDSNYHCSCSCPLRCSESAIPSVERRLDRSSTPTASATARWKLRSGHGVNQIWVNVLVWKTVVCEKEKVRWLWFAITSSLLGRVIRRGEYSQRILFLLIIARPFSLSLNTTRIIFFVFWRRLWAPRLNDPLTHW